MKRIVALAMGALFLVGCPDNGPPPKDNGVVMVNLTHDFKVVEVAISESGTDAERANLAEDPIEPGFSQGFCCYVDGAYDIIAVIEEIAGGARRYETRWFNETFEGPMSHIFEIYQPVPGKLAITDSSWNE